MEWSRPAAGTIAEPTALEKLGRRIDWEDVLTLLLVIAAAMSVAMGVESSGWSEDMPNVLLVSVLGVTVAMLLHRSRMSMFGAWPLGVIIGAAVTLWQALVMVGPGTLGQRIDAVYTRFDIWYEIAQHGGVSNDSLPFNTLIVSITWLGAFLFSWAVFRWHNAWIGLIPGGIALFTTLVFVTDHLTGAIILYLLFGFMLVSRTNLTAKIDGWRRNGTGYPSLISLTFLNFTAWLMLGLITMAWILPAGPFSTPAVVDRAADGVARIGTDFVRLAGPLHTQKVIPVHSYTGVLPFQGSVNLGERELLEVKLDPTLEGPFALRGAVYDEYLTGGWESGNRTEVTLPEGVEDSLRSDIAINPDQGQLVPLEIHVERKSVVGTVVFSIGEPVSTDESDIRFEVPTSSIETTTVSRTGTDPLRHMTDSELAEWASARGDLLLHVERGDSGVRILETIRGAADNLPDTLVVRPPDRIRRGEFYEVTGYVPNASPVQLRAAETIYPSWIETTYLQLPDSLPNRVEQTAQDTVVAQAAENPYDQAKALESFLRSYPIDYGVGDTPPGEDTVDYFLHESRRGYFDYHASAMVVMLRTLGVPARLAVGFVVGEEDYSLTSRTYTVRDQNSYAWTEVYFPDYGWISFNPTPDRPEALVPRERTVPLPDGPLTLEDFPDLPVGADPIFDQPGVPGENPVQVVSGGGGSNDSSGIGWYLAGIVAVLGLVAGAGFVGWRRSVAGLPYSQQTWEKMVRLAGWSGHAPQAGQTPTDYANALQKSVRDLRGVSVITDAYNRSRFGQKTIATEEEDRIRELWPPLRNSLIGSIIERPFRRGK